MGVHGTFCQLCALPVNHDHYIPTPGGMLRIYRGGTSDPPQTWNDAEQPFPFTPDHDWLRRAVGIEHGTNKILRGEVSDGNLTDDASGDTTMPFEGDDDARTYHAYCYEALGSPTDSRALTARGTHAFALLAPYHEQLFELQLLADDDKAWMLADPATSPRSRDRIAAAVGEAKRVAAARPTAEPTTIDDILALDAGWQGVVFHDVSHRRRELLRYRADIVPGLDCREFVDLVCVVKEYADDPLTQPTAAVREQLEAFEVLLKTTVERDRAAIHVATMFGGERSQAQFILYARNAAATAAAIRALPDVAADDVSIEPDPTWKIFFAEVIPRR